MPEDVAAAFEEFKPKLQSNGSRETSPNRGQSKPDVEAISDVRMTIDEWRNKVGIDPSQQIRLVKMSHMRYQHPDLAILAKFLKGDYV
jgi:hypothetical protein